MGKGISIWKNGKHVFLEQVRSFVTAFVQATVTSEHPKRKMKWRRQTELVKQAQLKGKRCLILNWWEYGTRPLVSLIKGKKVYLKFCGLLGVPSVWLVPDTDEIAKEAGDDYVVFTVVSP